MGDSYMLTGDADGRWPLVIASPHSGRHYPADFLARSALALPQLRRAEDALVDQLLAGISGVPVLCARYGRAYLDLNRAASELDPDMFEGALGLPVQLTDRVGAGLGVLPRMAGPGLPIYRERLPAGEAAARLASVHQPWHETLTDLLERTRARHGYAVLIDCHSMPRPAGVMPPQIVLGDRHGQSASEELVALVERHFEGAGWRVTRNTPYAGGYITQHHGRPAEGVHVVQIEIDRGLYLDAGRLLPGPGFARMARVLQALVRLLLAASQELALAPAQRLAAE